MGKRLFLMGMTFNQPQVMEPSIQSFQTRSEREVSDILRGMVLNITRSEQASIAGASGMANANQNNNVFYLPATGPLVESTSRQERQKRRKRKGSSLRADEVKKREFEKKEDNIEKKEDNIEKKEDNMEQ